MSERRFTTRFAKHDIWIGRLRIAWYGPWVELSYDDPFEE